MRKISFTFLVLILGALNLNCSGDDNGDGSKPIENLPATVKAQISCQTTNNGFVFEIELDEEIMLSGESTLKSIGIVNLPENLKLEGTRIQISVKQADSQDGPCITLYSPEYFFESINATIIP